MIIIGIFLCIVAAAVVATILVSLFCFIKKHAAAFGKVVALTAAVVVITVLFGGVFYGAFAEDLFDEIEVEEFVAVEPVLFDGEALLLISFEYHGDILSWYEEGEFYPGSIYKLTIFNGVEVVGAELVQEGGEPCFPH